MIVRDSLNIICQHDPNNPSYCDGGDSARSTGIMATFGSLLDQKNLWYFEEPHGSGLLTRHPTQYGNDDFTRDQLLPMMSGLQVYDPSGVARRVFWAQARRLFFCQNYMEQFPSSGGMKRRDKGFFGRDPLSPSHIGFMILCAEIWYLYPFLLIAIPWFILDLFFATKVRPRMEQNQIVCMAKVYGLLGLWTKWHPNWKASLHDYWSGWRDQKEIAEFIIQGIQRELEKEQL